ncbi:MAG TPA: hypothetical protein VKU40_18745 [Thermoanaerobaculia bacterium]|nr:hypothetical protein [Thermoanaerobaculia bacterium]
MSIYPADHFGPAPADALLAYPGRTPAVSFLYADGEVQLLPERPLAAAGERLATRGSAPLADRLPVLCSGSNANPAQIRRKLADAGGDRDVPVLRARVAGLHAVYAGHVSIYGAIPATLAPVGEGTDCGAEEIFVAFYEEAQLARVTASEGNRYVLTRLAGAACCFAGESDVPGPSAFLATAGVLTFDGETAVGVAGTGQRELLERVFERLAPGAVPALDDYLAAPRRHRDVLDRAIGEAGLRRDVTW